MTEAPRTEQMGLQKEEATRYWYLPTILKIAYLIVTFIGISLFIMWIFAFQPFGFIFSTTQYFYLLFACFTFGVFVVIPANRRDPSHSKRVPWYDVVLGSAASLICIYFFLNARPIDFGWVQPPNLFVFLVALVFLLICLEGGRRIGGVPFIIVAALIGLYPLIASQMPGIFYGRSLSFPDIVGNFAFGRHGVLGLPAGVIGNYLLAFFIFAGVLMASGAGESFLKLALALAGRFRGGAAKVAVVASGFFGSLSESTTANIMTTGALTIPAMKRTGFKAEYAGAVEACASGAGNLMPPVMGGIAFVICVMTGLEYATIMIASFVPVLLYYLSLFLVVDAHAAKNGLLGLPRDMLPSLKGTIKRGWMFIFVLAFMTWGLVYLRWEAKAPIYSALLMIALGCIYRDTRINLGQLHEIMVKIAGLISTVFAIILPVGLILSGLMTTGVPANVTAYIIGTGGESIPMVLLLGVFMAFIMGMAGMALTAYLFLAVTLLPPLITVGGINLTGAHLFVMYIVLYSGLTPPVAIAAFVASGIAQANPMKTAVVSMRLGWTLFVVSFYLLFSPGLILQAPFPDILYAIITCGISIPMIVGGIEGYLLKVGPVALWARPLVVIAGLMVGFPTTAWPVKLSGLALFLLTTLTLMMLAGRRRTAGLPRPAPATLTAKTPATLPVSAAELFNHLVRHRLSIVISLFCAGAVLLAAGLMTPYVILVYLAVLAIALAAILMRLLRKK